MPKPIANDDIRVSDVYKAVARATAQSPITTTRVVPKRRTNFGAFGEPTMRPIATGISMIPDLSGL